MNRIRSFLLAIVARVRREPVAVWGVALSTLLGLLGGFSGLSGPVTTTFVVLPLLGIPVVRPRVTPSWPALVAALRQLLLGLQQPTWPVGGKALAVGVHHHPTRKLGKRPPTRRPAIAFAAHSPLDTLTAPVADPAPGLTWPLDANDVWGDCVVAALDHALQAIHAALGVPRASWTPAEILAYYRTQNPSFDPAGAGTGPGSSADGGMDVQTFLEALVADGTILGFAKVDHTDEAQMKNAVYLGLGIVTGEGLRVAQQTQQVWDYSPGSPEWGGHATTTVGYPGSPDTDSCVTWGTQVEMTQAFAFHQVDEAWFVLTQAHVDHPGFRESFDLAGFAAAYTAITGSPFPAVIPPLPPAPIPVPAPPAPAPVPPTPVPVPPAPGAGADRTLAPLAHTWLGQRHTGATNLRLAAALRAWLHSEGL